MQILKADFDLGPFWSRLHQAEQALLLLDFDGTLSPFVIDPALARPYPGVIELLGKIVRHGQTRLVVISGRDVDSLNSCLGLEPVPELWGCHGWQRRMPGGRTLQRGLPADAEGLLRQAELLAEEHGYALNLEKKPVSLALHWRGLAPERIKRMQDLVGDQWRQLTTSGELQLNEFDGGLELRSPGVHKGTAVEQLLVEVGPGTEIAYLGDDLTDEDAFAALDGHGLKVLVRSQLRETFADVWLQPPEQLLWFFEQWLMHRGEF
jgi:trehalose-phosphatase